MIHVWMHLADLFTGRLFWMGLVIWFALKAESAPRREQGWWFIACLTGAIIITVVWTMQGFVADGVHR